MNKAIRFALLAVGLAIFAWFIHKAGPHKIWTSFTDLGWKAPLTLVPFFLVHLLDSWSWQLSFGRDASKLSFLTLIRVRWAGEAVNCTIPSGSLLGEAVKVYLLHKRGLEPVLSGSAALVSRSCQTLAMGVFVAIGALLAIDYLPEGSSARPAMVATTVGLFVLTALLFWLQSHGTFTILLRITRRLGWRIRQLEDQAEHLIALDQRVVEFYTEQRGYFIAATVVSLIAWIVGVSEVILVCHLLGSPLDWELSWSVEAFVMVAKFVGVFTPGSVGVQEAGAVFIFDAFALAAPIGIAYAIIRRGREIVYTLLGWIFIYTEESSFTSLLDHAKSDAAEAEIPIPPTKQPAPKKRTES